MVEDAQVVSIATDRGNKAVAFILLNEKIAFCETVLLGFCKQTLAGFKVPIKIIPIDAFPTTPSPNGTKIQKSALRELATQSI
jgi:fatty-acyl-CoA synthase